MSFILMLLRGEIMEFIDNFETMLKEKLQKENLEGEVLDEGEVKDFR